MKTEEIGLPTSVTPDSLDEFSQLETRVFNRIEQQSVRLGAHEVETTYVVDPKLRDEFGEASLRSYRAIRRNLSREELVSPSDILAFEAGVHGAPHFPPFGTPHHLSGGPSYLDFCVFLERAISCPVETLRSTTSEGIKAPFRSGQVSASDEALERLRKFRSWKDNWDGEGGLRPDLQTINAAIYLLSLIANTYREFGVHLSPDGRPVFFPRNSEWSGEIVVEDPNHISYEFRRGTELRDEYDLPFDGRRLPDKLRAALDLL